MTIGFSSCAKDEGPSPEDSIFAFDVPKVQQTQEYPVGVFYINVGGNGQDAARYSRFVKPRSFVSSGGMGTMGFGLPAAIGATFGQKRPVVLFVGDGGLQMTVEELGTVMEQDAPVKIVLLNNNYLGNVRQWQALFFRRRYSFTPMLNPDYEKLAEAYGIPATTVTERGRLAEAVMLMMRAHGPYLLQVAVMEEDNVLPMCCPGNDVDDMLLTADGEGPQ